MLLPKRIISDSSVHIVHTSSPIEREDYRDFETTVARLKKLFAKTKIFNVERNELDPRYLAASENERLRLFREAIKKANWLLPAYGGTGCADIVRHLDDDDLRYLKNNRPLVNGFSDTTYLLNYLYFKLHLLTLHYANASGIFDSPQSELFFNIITGRIRSFGYNKPDYQWLTDRPTKPITGVAIGGNLESFRDLLDISDIKPISWDNFILFIEDIEMDVEDIHRILISLDQKGVFKTINAIVVGRFDNRGHRREYQKFNLLFGRGRAKKVSAGRRQIINVFQYLAQDIISERLQDRDPLYLLSVDNLGHHVKNPMIVPIGAPTVIYPDKTIEFLGPFVK